MATIPSKFNTGVFYILDSANRLVTFIEINSYEDYRKIMSIKKLSSDDFKFKYDSAGAVTTSFSGAGVASDISVTGLNATPQSLSDAPAFGAKDLSDTFPDEVKSVSSSVTTITATRQSFISSLHLNYTDSAGTVNSITGDFEPGDILFVMPKIGGDDNGITITSAGNIDLNGSNFVLRVDQDGNNAPSGKFMILKYVSSVLGWSEMSRSVKIVDELPQQTPATNQKFYLSKNSAGTLAFSSIENAATQNLILKFSGQITAAGSIVLGALPANSIVLGDRIMAKIDSAISTDNPNVTLSIGGSNLISNTALQSTFIYGTGGAADEVTLNNSGSLNSPYHSASPADVTFQIDSGNFSSASRAHFSLIIPYIQM